LIINNNTIVYQQADKIHQYRENLSKS